MTGTNLSIRFVLILATAICIHGKEAIPEATLTVMSDFEDGLADREFRVFYPGGASSTSATIKIFQAETTKVHHTISNADKPQLLHFELKKEDAPAGSYEVQVCLSEDQCSPKRASLGEIVDQNKKPKLSCKTLNGKEENEFDRFSGKTGVEEVFVSINAGGAFYTADACKGLPVGLELSPQYNPAYISKQKIFYAAVSYNGKLLKDLFATIATNGYCSRKYIYWVSANVVDKDTKEVKRRYRGTQIVSKALADRFILDPQAIDFPVEVARYDEEALTPGNYYVSFSFCASDKDRANSSICSEAMYENLQFY